MSEERAWRRNSLITRILAWRHTFPTAEIDQMLADIERGYLGPTTR